MILFTFPFAGGSAAYYNNWKSKLSRDITLKPIELKGRGKRISEPLYKNFDEMLDDVYATVKPDILKNDFMFFGHSMGATIAFELSHRLQANGLPLPIHMFLSGRLAPDCVDDFSMNALPDKGFQQAVIRKGGMNAELFQHQEWVELFLPVIRKDFIIIAAQDELIQNNLPPLHCNFTVLNGKDDHSIETMNSWSKFTSKKFEFLEFDGGHFFINDHLSEVISLINQTHEQRLAAKGHVSKQTTSKIIKYVD